MKNCGRVSAVHPLSITLAAGEKGTAPASIPIALRRSQEDHGADRAASLPVEEEEGSLPPKHYLLLQPSCLQPARPTPAALPGAAEPHPTALP